MLMWVMSDRAIPRSYRMMEGFGVHTFRLVNDARRVALRASSTGSPMLGMHSLVWDEAREDLPAPIPTSTAATCGRRSRPATIPEWELGLQVFTEEQADALQLRRARRRPSSCPRNWCRCRRSAAWCSTATRTTSSPRPSRWPSAPRTSCPASTSPTTRCWPGASTRTSTRRSRRLGGAELPRDPDQRAARAGAQQPARRHAPPGDPPRPRRLRAELARRRLPVPGRRARASCRFPQPIAASDKVRGKPEKFADHYTQATLFCEQPDAGRAGAHRRRPSASSSRR